MYQPKKEKIFNPFRIGKKENYVNDHELYEMLRSRELFRLQLDLRKSLKIKLRGLANVQKVNIASLESRKRGFLQRVTRRNKPVLNYKKLRQKRLQTLRLKNNDLEQRVKNFSFSDVMSGYQSKR
ncbi:uncharacterized protein LOC126818062 [Patella vulgata]|uniref:uncharacterized protein LOC126818062 n=1 Tax=Patella vulgata TaxID=6465 RepID=UPI0024A9CBF4|nr:uncharacterized protein LOC126818062 [Patella vulgata]